MRRETALGGDGAGMERGGGSVFEAPMLFIS